MKAKLYILECLTNLHVGNGEVNYNIIDNEVERDVITGYPTINSSGVKGALRAFFNESNYSEVDIKDIFGSEENATTPGKLKFLSANLLAQAIENRHNNGKPYRIVSPETVESHFKSHVKDFLTEENIDFAIIKKYYGIQTIKDKELKTYDLPVLARNQLDNGISQNLWYEEVVPHKTLFYITVVSTGNDSSLLEKFDKAVNNKIIQFGANASIGYGFCKVINIQEVLKCINKK